jgi:hypothetical protein
MRIFLTWIRDGKILSRDSALTSRIRNTVFGIGNIDWNCVNFDMLWLKRFLCREAGSDRVCANGCGLRRSLCRHQGKK